MMIFLLSPSQLSGIRSENLELKACLSHGRKLIPTLSAHFDPYSDYPLPPPLHTPPNMQQPPINVHKVTHEILSLSSP